MMTADSSIAGPLPAPGSAEELARFTALQAALPHMYRRVFSNDLEPRTIIIVPSLSLDQDVLARVAGAHHYEERMLCLLMLLRLPRARVVYLSSTPIPDSIVDYYLHLLPGVPARHARERLTLLSCHDASNQPLTAKLLARPRLLERVRQAMGDPARAHLTCFNVTEFERSLAVALGAPVYGADPAHLPLASKSGGRKLMRGAGVALPDGAEDLRDMTDVAAALAELKARDPALRRAVVKLNEGFSGEGNAVFAFDDAPATGLEGWIRDRLSTLRFEAEGMTLDLFAEKFGQMEGIVEAFVEGADKRSPSAQYRVDPVGGLETISTHDQVLAGQSGQVFTGCVFPADPAYRLGIAEAGLPAAAALRDAGVIGRFAIDFVSARTEAGWRHYAIEINLRKGGTTHPFHMLQFLAGGGFEPASGLYRAPDGGPLYYFATDNLVSADIAGLTPEDLMDVAVLEKLHFDSAALEGVAFHLIGALSEFGKLGAVCVARRPERAQALYNRVEAALRRGARRERA